jgi:proline dehydrogenase
MPDRWALPNQDAALKWCANRNELGIRCTLDILGHISREEVQAKSSYDAYIDLTKEIVRRKLNASLSVKISTLGGTVNREMTKQFVGQLGDKCHKMGVEIELDMEGQRMVDLTLLLAEERARAGQPITVALQAYLNRTPRDVERMMDAGVKVRLVKGAYSGDLSDFNMIAEVYKDLVELLISYDRPFGVATHDPDVLEWVKNRIRDKEILEFGFLMGLADTTKERLVAEGWKVAEYVPFGSNREGYEARRKIYLKKLDELGRLPAP